MAKDTSKAVLLAALRQVVNLCDDGDADELTREAAKIAKRAIAAAEGNGLPPTQAKVLAVLQTLSQQWCDVSTITYTTKLSTPSARTALTLLHDKGYVRRKEFYRGLAPYQERVTKYIVTSTGMGV